MAAADIFAEIIIMFAVIVLTIIAGIAFLIFYIARAHGKIKELQENPEKKEGLFEDYRKEISGELQNAKLVPGDLEGNIQKISGIKKFITSKKTPLSRKIKYSFFRIGEFKAFIRAFGFFIPMRLLPTKLTGFDLYDGVIFAKTNDGTMACRLENGALSVNFEEEYIGKINLNEKEIYDSKNKKIGYTDRSDIVLTGISTPIGGVLMPVKYSVFIKNKKACGMYVHPSTYGLLKSSIESTPLIQNLDAGISKETKLLLLALGIWDSMYFEYIEMPSPHSSMAHKKFGFHRMGGLSRHRMHSRRH